MNTKRGGSLLPSSQEIIYLSVLSTECHSKALHKPQFGQSGRRCIIIQEYPIPGPDIGHL